MKMTEEQREKVRRLRSEGMTLVEVAQAVGCSLKSASRVHVRPSHGEKGIKAWYPGCRRLSYEDRERIAYGLAHRESFSCDRAGAWSVDFDYLARGQGQRRPSDLSGLFSSQSGLSAGPAAQGGQARSRSLGRGGHPVARGMVVSLKRSPIACLSSSRTIR